MFIFPCNTYPWIHKWEEKCIELHFVPELVSASLNSITGRMKPHGTAPTSDVAYLTQQHLSSSQSWNVFCVLTFLSLLNSERHWWICSESVSACWHWFRGWQLSSGDRPCCHRGSRSPLKLSILLALAHAYMCISTTWLTAGNLSVIHHIWSI